MITINTQRLDTEIEILLQKANNMVTFKKERIEILNNASVLIEKFVADAGCINLEIGNMYTTGNEYMHNDEKSLLCHGNMAYKTKAPINKELFAKKLNEKFDKIVKSKEQRISAHVIAYDVKDEFVKFSIYIRK